MTHSLHTELVRISGAAKAASETVANPVYVRGTKTEKRNASRLEPGDRVLTSDVNWYGEPSPSESRVFLPAKKTGAIVRTVAATSTHRSKDPFSRQSKKRVDFTDGTFIDELAPIQTFDALLRG